MKFIQPVEITAEYKITTPMFLGGAFPGESIDSQQFRNASLKGALRFWWRALNWGRMLRECSGDEATALKKLHAREGELFGKASDGKDSVQSRVQLSTKLEGSKQQPAGPGLASLGYLLGQGLYHFQQGLLRPHLSGGSLQVTARFKPGTSPTDLDSIKEALTALGLFGGLGSRARKGFGSLAIQHIGQQGEDPYRFNSQQQIEQFIASLDFSAPGNAPLTAFSSQSRIDCLSTGGNATALLVEIGNEMQLYRSYGRNGLVNRQESRRNFVPDHDNALKAANGERIAELPKRGVFGLPHNYYFSSNRTSVQIAPSESSMSRRASPLLIHIHELPNGQCLAIQTLLPGRFLPKNTEIELRGRRSNTLTDPSVDYQVIHRYLDGFPQRKVLRHAQ